MLFTFLLVVQAAPSSGTSPTAVTPQLIHISGRTIDVDGGIVFDWPGTTISAQFRGNSIHAVLSSLDGGAAFELVVDETNRARCALSGGVETCGITVPKASRHTVRLTRISEGELGGPTQFHSFVGALEPRTSPWKHRIEVFGDSQASGFGVLGRHPRTCPYTASMQNFSQSWPALVAAHFHADLHAVVGGGMGLSQGWATPKESKAFELFWNRTMFSQPELTWDFSSWIPELLIIQLGNNDITTKAPQENMEAAFLRLIQKIRSQYPTTPILVAGGNYTSEILERLVTNLKDANLWFFPLTFHEREPMVCWHPTASTHARWAQLTIEEVERRLHW